MILAASWKLPTTQNPNQHSFKAHLESQGVLFDNRFREEFENELVNYSEAMNFYNRYKKLNKNRKLLGILPFPILYSGTYIIIAMNSLASLIILSPESSSQLLDAFFIFKPLRSLE